MTATLMCQLVEMRTFINGVQDKMVRGRFDLASRGQEEEIRKMTDLCQPETLIYLVAMTENEYNEAMKVKEKK